MKISIHDPRLPALWTKAVKRGLSITGDDGIYFVGSSSVTGLFHKVVIEGETVTCTCASMSACTHRALALAEHSYSHWSEYFYAEKERFIVKRRTLESKAWAKVFARRKKAAPLLFAAFTETAGVK